MLFFKIDRFMLIYLSVTVAIFLIIGILGTTIYPQIFGHWPAFDFKVEGRYDNDTAAIYGNWQKGNLSYTNDVGSSCNINPPVRANWKHLKFGVSISSEQYANAAACGACIRGYTIEPEITKWNHHKDDKGFIGYQHNVGPRPAPEKWFAQVVDECVNCSLGEIHTPLHGYYGGTFEIRWHFDSCTVGSDGLQYQFSSNSNLSFLEVNIRDHRTAIVNVSMQPTKLSPFIDAVRTNDNYFQVTGFEGEAEFPLEIRVTAASGQTISDAIPVFEIDPNYHIDGLRRAQFQSYKVIVNKEPWRYATKDYILNTNSASMKFDILTITLGNVIIVIITTLVVLLLF